MTERLEGFVPKAFPAAERGDCEIAPGASENLLRTTKWKPVHRLVRYQSSEKLWSRSSAVPGVGWGCWSFFHFTFAQPARDGFTQVFDDLKLR